MQYRIIVDKQPSSNPSDEKKEYTIDIEELRVKGKVYDSLNIELDKTYVTRRLSLSEYGVLTVLDEPVIEELKDLDINLFEGDNYVYLSDMQGNKFYAEYLIKNDFNDIYATKNEMNSAITQTASSIELSVNQKLEGYSTTEEMNSAITQTAEEINLEVSKKVGEDEVCSVISQRPEEILLKGNRVLVESNFFNLSKEGTVTIFDKQTGSSTADTSANLTIVTEEEDLKTQITPNRILISGEDSKSYFWNTNSWAYVGVSSDNEMGKCRMVSAGSDLTFIDCSDGISTSKMTPQEVKAQKLTQTSLEGDKKNFEKMQDNALDIIKNIDIYKYNLKTENDIDKKHIGFVIGEGYNYSKEVTSEKNDGVDIYSFASLCCKAIQEQQEMIKQLELEIKQLKEVANG